MIYVACLYLLSVWLVTVPAVWVRAASSKNLREANAVITLWAVLPALLLISPALLLGYVVLWLVEQVLRGLVAAARGAWRAWMAIGEPAAEAIGWMTEFLIRERTV